MKNLRRQSLFTLLCCTLLVGSFAVSTAHASELPTSLPTENQKHLSRKEAYRASTGQIVLHYGQGIKRVNNIKDVLLERGYPTIAYPGGPQGLIELFVHVALLANIIRIALMMES
ncbi:MAG: hypothetical protein L3J28_07190 [Candidatus Polarisedimenticolaceae bacterium]|nr:hypothetical protein [Candidatus Polarisedimenticolaceae bacterium]